MATVGGPLAERGPGWAVDGLNLFRMSRSNPATFSDYDGLFPESFARRGLKINREKRANVSFIRMQKMECCSEINSYPEFHQCQV